MAAQYQSHNGGAVQTLRYLSGERQVEVGVFEAGEHQFTLDRRQTVRVLDGHMSVNGDTLLVGAEREFNAGDTVLIVCDGPVAYICFYA
ncbi:MAG: hypothetical protein HYV32_06490 [Candidatus Kerfeldbacteria bacterium]|nr:hypothetical protein [Candidatus Kerfeldbacteria bacterium]